jgi:hypothetical protein
MKVEAQYEVLGWRSERVTRPGRDDRLPACAREAVCEKRGAKPFYRPCRDGHFFLYRFSALRTGPLSLRPCGGGRNVCAWPTRDHSVFQLHYGYGYRVVLVSPRLVDRPSGTGRVSRSIPGTSYRATFIESLRDRSSEAHRSSLDCQLVIANRRGTGSREVWPNALIRPTRSFLVNLISTQLPCSKKS